MLFIKMMNDVFFRKIKNQDGNLWTIKKEDHFKNSHFFNFVDIYLFFKMLRELITKKADKPIKTHLLSLFSRQILNLKNIFLN